MMKKILALILSLTLVFSLTAFPVFAEEDIPQDDTVITPGENENGDDEPYYPFDDYDDTDDDGNYVPMGTYFMGHLVPLDESVDITQIKQVALTSGDISYTVDVDSDGYFKLSIPDTNDAMTVSIPDSNYYILPDNPPDNNKLFTSLSETTYKDIYVGVRSSISGTVTTSDESGKIAGASVTCYYRPTKNDEWTLWMNNEFAASANTTTDSEGKFSYAVTSGLYRFVIKKEGYTDYDSAQREYTVGIAPVANQALNVTFHMTANKFMSLVSVNPEQGGVLAPKGTIEIEFSKNVSKDSVSSYTNLRLESVSNKNTVPFTATVNGTKASIKPNTTLFEGQKYNLYITKNITATDGSSLDIERTITFTCSSEAVNNDNTNDDEQQNSDQPVTDDITGHWSEKFMKRLIDLNIIDGEEQDGYTYYYPDKALTRAEFAKYIVMSQNIETSSEISGTFKDGDLIAYELRPYVYGAVNVGLIQGSQEEDGLYFMPDATISRAEIITVLGRLIGDESDEPLNFADADEVPDWARPYVAGCVSKGYVTGDYEGTSIVLRPLDSVTRCEAATIISKILDDTQQENTVTESTDSETEDTESIDNKDTDEQNTEEETSQEGSDGEVKTIE